MRKIYLLAIGSLLSIASFAQLKFQASMIAGPGANSVDIVIRPTVNFTGYLTNVVFVIQVPDGVAQPTITTTSLSTYFPTFNTLATVNTPGYYNYGYTATNAALIATTTVNAGANYPVLRLTFTGGPVTPTDIRLVNLANGGPGFLYQFYAEANNGVANDYTNYAQMFFGGIVSPAAPYPDEATGYGSYQYMQLATVLPVTVTDFYVTKSGNDGLLTWHVQDQSADADHFEIERSFNGTNFVKIGRTEINANPGAVATYHYTDANVVAAKKAGIIYYRVRSIEHSGRAEYTQIQNIRVAAGAFDMTVSPNPANFYTMLSYGLNVAGKVDIIVTDASGKEMSRTAAAGVLGANLQRINVANLASGRYVITLRSGDQVQSIPFVKGLQ